MNPFLILQGAGAAAGLIGSLIPDQQKTVEHVTNIEGSSLAGRVPGQEGAQSISTFTTETSQSPIKKGLLKFSNAAGMAGAIGSNLFPGAKIPALKLGNIASQATEMASSLVNTNLMMSGVAKSSSDSSQNMTDTELQQASEVWTPEMLLKINPRFR